jgi:CIC family chloride channel protein
MVAFSQLINERFKNLKNFSLILPACVTGILAGCGAIAFAELIAFVQKLALGSSDLPLRILPHLAWYHIAVVPAVGGFAVALVTFFAQETRGHGVSEVIEAVVLQGGRIRPRVALIQSLASALTIGTGGSVGREGPMVQIGAALGSTVGQIWRAPPEYLRTLVGCGAAGGIAAAFNAPIAGAFFALEVIMGNFAMPTFAPVVMAAVLATMVSRAYFGDYPAFIVPTYTLNSVGELPLYLVLGILCGLVGVVFTVTLYSLEDLFNKKIKLPSLLKPACGGLLLGIIAVFVPNIYGIGYATMDAALRGEIGWGWLLLLLPVKLFATSLTLASGGSGGVFLPSLYIGAVTGGLFGFAVNGLFPTVVASGAYAMVGMAALLAAATHSPITSMILLFELTGDYKIILPVMIACTLSTLVARWLKEDSIYTLKLARLGLDLRRREDVVMRTFRVEQVMRRDVNPIRQDVPFPEIIRHFLESDVPVCFVVDGEKRMVGEVSIHDVKASFREEGLGNLVIARDLANGNAMTVAPTDTLADCMEKLSLSGQEYLPVVLPQSRELVGVISRRDVIDLYNREILRSDYLGLTVGGEEGSRQVQGYIRLPRDYQLEVVPIPREFVGKSLREINLRASYNVTVVALKQGGEYARDELPDPNRRLGAEDFLVLVGRKEDMERFLRIMDVGAARELAP